MSGPVSALDAVPGKVESGRAGAPVVEVTPSRQARVGTSTVRRALPRRGRRTVGAWCFVDHFGPTRLSPPEEIEIGPHPHIGLHTVTWLTAGEMLHTDSLGSEQLIRPGQLNLMSAGAGVAHAEQSPTGYQGDMHGLQLWVAQPEETRHGEPAFEHHSALPQVELGDAVATVLVGELAGARSPARADTPLLGAEVTLRRGSVVLPLQPDFEYAVVVLEGGLVIGPEQVRPGALGYLGQGREELQVAADEPTRGLLIDGVPFPEQVLMWWNFVARSRDEIVAAQAEWQSGRDEVFARVRSPLARIEAPATPWG
ncbi:MAG: pirin family protein [Mycobacteriales bacterium]